MNNEHGYHENRVNSDVTIVGISTQSPQCKILLDYRTRTHTTGLKVILQDYNSYYRTRTHSTRLELILQKNIYYRPRHPTYRTRTHTTGPQLILQDYNSYYRNITNTIGL